MTPRFICFDLDGTLYLDSCVYLRMIDHFFHDTPYRDWIFPVQEQMKQVLSGQSSLRCGQFVPKQKAEHPKLLKIFLMYRARQPFFCLIPPLAGSNALFLHFRRLDPGYVSGPQNRLGRRRLLEAVPAGAERSDRSILGACTESGSSCPS